MTRNHAEILRTMIVKASVSLDDSDALEAVELFPVWAAGVYYPKDERVNVIGAVRNGYIPLTDLIRRGSKFVFTE